MNFLFKLWCQKAFWHLGNYISFKKLCRNLSGCKAVCDSGLQITDWTSAWPIKSRCNWALAFEMTCRLRLSSRTRQHAVNVYGSNSVTLLAGSNPKIITILYNDLNGIFWDLNIFLLLFFPPCQTIICQLLVSHFKSQRTNFLGLWLLDFGAKVYLWKA